jgi:hypothetical protein
MLSQEIHDVEFDLEDVFVDEDADIYTASIYGIVDELIFFWRFNLNEDGFKIQGEKDYSKAEKMAFKKRVNQFFEKYSSETRERFLRGYKNTPNASEDVFDYVNETLLLEEDKIRLVDLKE